MFIIRRKDPPAYAGAKTWWQTVAHRDTLREAQEAMQTLKRFAKPGTGWWCGEEKENPEETE
jgi:hypothetical protein